MAASLHSCSLNLNSIKCLTNHLRSVEHSTFSITNSLHLLIAFSNSSAVASYKQDETNNVNNINRDTSIINRTKKNLNISYLI